jgi:hypothetical protein
MIVKSNSVPNFLFEKPINNTKRKLSFKILNKQKVISYEDFVKNNSTLLKNERINNLNALYYIVFKNSFIKN